MNESQAKRIQEIVQEIATDENISFDEAFETASNYLAYWVSEMPKGRAFAGGGSHQTGFSQADQSLDSETNTEGPAG